MKAVAFPKQASAYLHDGNLLHASFAGFAIVITNLVDTYYLAKYSWSCQAEVAETFVRSHNLIELSRSSTVTYNPWKNALLRYSK